jgi:DNA-binding transcriptional regulator LsrR (DeoR family)
VAIPHPPPRRHRPVSLEAAIVARRYYLDQLQKNEIAQELGLSRFKVARLIDEARAAGIVHIHVEMPANLDITLGDELAAAFGLRRAVVAKVDDRTPELALSLLGAAAADLLASLLRAGDVLGISWGQTLTHLVDSLGPLPAVDVVQLVGGMRTGPLAVSGTELLRRLSQNTVGEVFPLYAPMFVQSPEVAAALRQDPSLQEAIGRFGRLTVAVVGVGSWTPPRSALRGELPEPDRDRLTAAGAVADVCAAVLDVDGNPIRDQILDRAVGISLDELRAVPEVVGVAGGADKVKALRAALRSGLLHSVATDTACARALLG